MHTKLASMVNGGVGQGGPLGRSGRDSRPQDLLLLPTRRHAQPGEAVYNKHKEPWHGVVLSSELLLHRYLRNRHGVASFYAVPLFCVLVLYARRCETPAPSAPQLTHVPMHPARCLIRIGNAVAVWHNRAHGVPPPITQVTSHPCLCTRLFMRRGRAALTRTHFIGDSGLRMWRKRQPLIQGTSNAQSASRLWKENPRGEVEGERGNQGRV